MLKDQSFASLISPQRLGGVPVVMPSHEVQSSPPRIDGVERLVPGSPTNKGKEVLTDAPLHDLGPLATSRPLSLPQSAGDVSGERSLPSRTSPSTGTTSTRANPTFSDGSIAPFDPSSMSWSPGQVERTSLRDSLEAAPVSPPGRGHRRHVSRPSLGLDNEADLSGIDGVIEEKTPQEDRFPTNRMDDGVSAAMNGDIQQSAPDKSLPPIPSHASPTSPQASPPGVTSRDHRWDGRIVNDDVSRSVVAQRRQMRDDPSTRRSPPQPQSGPSIPFPTSQQSPPPSTSSAFGALGGLASLSTRLRAKSQPGQRADGASEHVPPFPNVLKKKASFPSRHGGSAGGSLDTSNHSGRSNTLAPPMSMQASGSSTPHSGLLGPPSATKSFSGSAYSAQSTSGSLISPLPEVQPGAVSHRPLHILRTLRQSMTGSGAYLTGTLHVSSAMWQSNGFAQTKLPGPKIQAQDTKVRCMEALLLHLEIVRATGMPLLSGERIGFYGRAKTDAQKIAGRSGSAAPPGAVEEFAKALEGFEDEMDGCCKALQKQGVSMGAWKGRKTGGGGKSWGSRLTRGVDKMTNNKASVSRCQRTPLLTSSLDSPEKYVDLLSTFCLSLQTIGESSMV